MKVLVVADDFTGALDTGVMFSLSGANTIVKRLPSSALNSVPDHIDVVVVNTDSRHLSREDSYNIVKKILDTAINNGYKIIYKKIDSALRGNIVPEISAVVDSVTQSPVAFIPAFPEINRVLKNGVLYTDNIPINESVFKDDPYSPVKESNIINLFKQHSNLKTQLVKKNENINFDGNTNVLVFDSETEEEMNNIGKVLKNKNLLNVSIGCASFAKVISSEIFGVQKNNMNTYEKNKIIISGSVNPITKEQIKIAETSGYIRISLTSSQLLAADYWNTDKGKNDINKYLTYIKKGKSIIFETFSNLTKDNINHKLQKFNIEINNTRQKITESLGELTRELFRVDNTHTYMFIGGDTLNQIMEEIQVNELYPIKELESGTVLSKIYWNNTEFHIISKSGGFGTKDLLLNI